MGTYRICTLWMLCDVPSIIIFLRVVSQALRENEGTHHVLVGEIWARRRAASRSLCTRSRQCLSTHRFTFFYNGWQNFQNSYYKCHLCLTIFFRKLLFFSFFTYHPTKTRYSILCSFISFCSIIVMENWFLMCYLQALFAEETEISSWRVEN